MKAMAIKRKIRAVVSEWLNSEPMAHVADQIKDDIIVSGGCIPSMIIGEKVQDYDIFFATELRKSGEDRVSREQVVEAVRGVFG